MMTHELSKPPTKIDLDFSGEGILEVETSAPLGLINIFNENSECVFPFGFTVAQCLKDSQQLILRIELGWMEMNNLRPEQRWYPPGKYKLLIMN